MGSEPASPALVSVVITVKNEARNVRRLLDSLVAQQPPFEVILVDALSHDGTARIAERFSAEHPGLLNVYRRYGSRGIGRNEGVRRARGEFVAFIDGDCLADSSWLQGLREGLRASDIAAGRTVSLGPVQYTTLERVELFQAGSDVTFPSCNLAYRRALFERLGGFDPHFITAEDIDLNLRAVQMGSQIHYQANAIVYHQVRTTLLRFLYQAFWNGYGRKQLTEKHGSLWGNYRIRRLLSGQKSVLAWARLTAALAGYVTRVTTAGNRRFPRAEAAAAAQALE